MFFSLSKIFGFFALPSNLLFTLALLGIVLMLTRFSRAGRMLLVSSVLLLGVIGLSPFGNALILPLEQRFPVWDASRGAPDGIVILGGAISPDVSEVRGEPALNESAERLTVIAALARQFPTARIVFTGGSGLLFGGKGEADFVSNLFESFGIAADRITLERQSRNTWENAVMTKAVAMPKPKERWLLVTSAHHMPRSIGIFRQAGFAVEAYPVDWRTRGSGDLWRPFGAVSAGLARTDTASREWAGLLVYWLTGKTSALFPGT